MNRLILIKDSRKLLTWEFVYVNPGILGSTTENMYNCLGFLIRLNDEVSN